MWSPKRLLSWVMVGMAAVALPLWATNERPNDSSRVFVLTDIENEPDDAQSLVRLLVHANQFEIEGLAATTSIWLRDRTAPERIRHIVRAYGLVQPNLARHEADFPPAEVLLGRVSEGVPRWGMQGVGPDQDSSASRALIAAIDAPDERPLWVLGWGGTNVLAQSLWRLQADRSPDEANHPPAVRLEHPDRLTMGQAKLCG